MRVIVIWIYTILFGSTFLAAQESSIEEKGVPKIYNLAPSQYENKGKIWEISNSPQGLKYMAADEGLLEFDGQRWIHYIGSQGYTRSVLVQDDSILFTGSDLDFGIWRRNDLREFKYTSLYTFRKEASKLNEEFWDIFNVNNKVCFVSSLNIYVYQNELLTRIAAPHRFVGQAKLGDTLYLSDEKEGLFSFDGWELKKVAEFPANNVLDIIGCYSLGRAKVFITRNRGSWALELGQWSKINSMLTSKLEKAGVFCFKEISKDRLAFGTVLKGLFIAEKEGRIIHQIDKQKGLLSNTILSLHETNGGVLWLGMDFGLAALDLQSCMTYIDDIKGEFGSAQTALLHNDRLYVGTNQGLYSLVWDSLNNSFPVPSPRGEAGTAGQVWSLTKVGGESFMGHDKGLFTLEENKWKQISADPGVWTIVPYKGGLLVGTYRGISFYAKENGKWFFKKKLDEIFGSCNQILLEKDSLLWVSIPNYGIIRVNISDNLDILSKAIFQASDLDSKDWQLVLDGEKVKIHTPHRTFIFDAQSDTLLSVNSASPLNRNADQQMPRFSSRVILNKGFEFYPRINGFGLKKRNCQASVSVQNANQIQWRRAWAFDNDQETPILNGSIIPYELNNIKIYLAVPDAVDPVFEWRLNKEDSWISIGGKSVLTVLDIPMGKTSISIRALVEGNYTAPITFYAEIARPWFLTWKAISGWFLILGLGLYFANTRYKKALQKQRIILLSKKQLALEDQKLAHQRQLEALEREAVQKENDLLKTQLKHKTVELATKAKENDDKNRLLSALKDKIEELTAGPQFDKHRLMEVKRLLDRFLLIEDKTFEIQMDDLHQDFFKKLRGRFPSLTPNDLRLCAYLKIGLSSKETADLLNVQPSSLYISRSRLRQKLELSPKDDLSAFLNGF